MSITIEPQPYDYKKVTLSLRSMKLHHFQHILLLLFQMVVFVAIYKSDGTLGRMKSLKISMQMYRDVDRLGSLSLSLSFSLGRTIHHDYRDGVRMV